MVASPGAVDVVDPRIDELSGSFAIRRLEVILLTLKLYDFVKVRYKDKLEHEKLLKKVLAEAKMSEEHIGAE